MILAEGKLYEHAAQDVVLARLESQINDTRATKTLSAETVISALSRLGALLEEGAFDEQIASLGLDGAAEYVASVALMLRRDSLSYRVRTELGAAFEADARTAPPFEQPPVTIRTAPLGTLLHIAAGNADGLPVLSVAEGLLTGNVNLVKLPQADNGLSVAILLRLIDLEPALADFIYVFDTPSTDLSALDALARLADGIITWGGDAAIAAVRQLAPPGVKLIEWGHKLSFAYLSGFEDEEAELTALARHILSTKQVLCSSCQVIYVDTEEMDEVHAFCKRFLPYLEALAPDYASADVGEAAERTLRRLSDRLDRIVSGQTHDGSRVYSGKHCRLTACEDMRLALSDMFGSCLVKRLPQPLLFSVLRQDMGYLQTCGLICAPARRAALSDALAACGLVRILRAGSMSADFCGGAHDGEYPLRRYVRIVNLQ